LSIFDFFVARFARIYLNRQSQIANPKYVEARGFEPLNGQST
jgi:hypothetical protein